MFTSEELRVIFFYDRGMDIHDIVEHTTLSALKISSIITKYISLPQEEFDIVTNQLENSYYTQVYDTY
jgi:hypothetical protein